jgi:hypothetical protein
MSKARVVQDLWSFLRQEKKYWLLPLALIFVFAALLLVFAESSALAPFIYSLF